jgi:hypothetical protein
MATLTIHHIDDLDVVDSIVTMCSANGGETSVDATRPGVTVAAFPSEAEARTIAAVLAQATAVTGLTIEPSAE